MSQLSFRMFVRLLRVQSATRIARRYASTLQPWSPPYVASKLSFFKTVLRNKAKKGFLGYPAATIMFYGPDDRRATKVLAGIVRSDEDEPHIDSWSVSEGDIRYDAQTFEAIHTLIRRTAVKSVAMPESILGCPHEEGIDYASGEACPECPFWAGRPRPIFDDEEDDDTETAREPLLPDRRGLEGVMGRLTGSGKETPLQQAQQLMWDAWDTNDRARRIALAYQALELSPDCADAYVMLAEETAAGLTDAIGLYANGVAAGERAIGSEAFEQECGNFWGILETRPYMRARAGLAECLQAVGKVDAAIGHYEALLRLNPSDNQGNRDMLAACLLETGQNAEARELLDRYPEAVTANWAYSNALVEFRVSGASASAGSALTSAIQINRHVPKFLLGKKRIPRSLPAHYSLGSEEEAVIYADLYAKNGKKTPGALDWLKAAMERS